MIPLVYPNFHNLLSVLFLLATAEYRLQEEQTDLKNIFGGKKKYCYFDSIKLTSQVNKVFVEKIKI